MPTLLRKILLLTVFFAFIICSTLAQKTKKKSAGKTLKEINYAITHPEKSPWNKLLDENLLPAAPIDPENIVDYFIKERSDVKYFTFIDKDKKETKIHIDSLLSEHKKLIDRFITRYKRQQNKDEEKLKKVPFKDIYEMILGLDKINYKTNYKAEINLIIPLINLLPNSEEKVDLFLKCARMGIQRETYYSDVYSFCNTAKKYADGIHDLYERGMAYIAIGIFAHDYQINDFAMQVYYLAREAVDNSNTNKMTKYDAQGLICQNIGDLFYEPEIEQSLQKEAYYYQEAANNYFRSGNEKKGDFCILYLIKTVSSLWTKFWKYGDDSTAKRSYSEVLNILKTWYTSFDEGEKFDYDVTYFGLHTIASNIYLKNTAIANLYFLDALFYASYGSSMVYITTCINNISWAYSEIGNKELSLQYSNLELYLTDKINNRYESVKSFLDRSQAFLSISEFDSAIVYTNNFISDTALKNWYYPSYYHQLLERAYMIKYQALDSLKQSDSARKYEREYLYYRLYHFRDLIYLIETETKSISEWLERSKGKEMNVEKARREIAEQNSELEKKLRKQADILTGHAEHTTMQALRQKIIADSLLIFKESLRLSDSARAGDKLRSAQDREKQKDANRKQQNWYYALAGIFSLLLFLALLGYIHQKNRNKNNKLQAEYDRVNGLAKNKIHNIENDYSDIGNLLEENDLEKLKNYNKNYEAFLAVFLENWRKEKEVTLEDELEATSRYIKAKAILKERLTWKIENTVEEPKKVKYLQSVFDTLLDNSFRHGFEKQAGNLQFAIQIKKVSSFLECIVTDNGIPPEQEELYLSEKESGLNLLKKRILGFYGEQKIKAKKDFFEINILPDRKGTIIKIKLPYVQI